MALRPLWNNVWGVPLYERPYREEATLHTPYARQRRKMLGVVKVVAVGEDCIYLSPDDMVILPEDHGGSVITIVNENKEIEHRFCFKETIALAMWQGELPPNVTEAGIINLEE